jgi:hypothetical protein
MTNKSSLQLLVDEVNSYGDLQDLEKLVEVGGPLSAIPVWPLYLILKNNSSEVVASVLGKLSKSQRVTMLDLDLWMKDEVDQASFSFWIDVFLKTENTDLIEELATSEQLALYLKTVVNIWTFDVEEPEYPDHDYYFLTEDGQLLVEYGENFEDPDGLRLLIKCLYGELGVEKAYAHLLKIVADEYLLFQEAEYQNKISRLQDFGFVDYYDALILKSFFPSIMKMDHYIDQQFKQPMRIGELVDEQLNQALDRSSLAVFTREQSTLHEELAKVTSQVSQSFLKFNFIRLVNSHISLTGALKESSASLYKAGESVKHFVELGLSYLSTHRDLKKNSEKNIFDYFNFFDLYKIGYSIIYLEKQKIKKTLKTHELLESPFVGELFSHFQFDLDLDFPKVRPYFSDLSKSRPVLTYSDFQEWQKFTTFFNQLIPFMSILKTTLDQMIKNLNIHQSFYVNFQIHEIDFETVCLSSFANHYLGNNVSQKFGLLPKEFRSFMKKILNQGNLVAIEKLANKISTYSLERGFGDLELFSDYLYALLKTHLEGHTDADLSDENLKHIGGVLILNKFDS